MPSTMAADLPKSVLAQYDLIGFDPRGVGLSTPQSCGLSDPSAPFPYPAPNGSIDQNIANGKALAQQCASKAPELKYFNTANTARDLDRLRADLGEDKISYWGQSYGTYLARSSPRCSRPAPTGWFWKGWSTGRRSGSRSRRCGVRGWTIGSRTRRRSPSSRNWVWENRGRGREELHRSDTRLDAKPAKVPGAPVSLTGTMIRNLTYGMLMRNENLPVVTQVWKAADDLSKGSLTKSDTKVMAQVLAQTAGAPGVPQDNTATMFLSIICGDVASSTDLAKYRTDVAADRKAHPLSGACR